MSGLQGFDRGNKRCTLLVTYAINAIKGPDDRLPVGLSGETPGLLWSTVFWPSSEKVVSEWKPSSDLYALVISVGDLLVALKLSGAVSLDRVCRSGL